MKQRSRPFGRARRRVRISVIHDEFLHRVLLYAGLVAAAVWTLRIYDRLEDRAVMAQNPFPAIAITQGELEAGNLANSLRTSGSPEAEIRGILNAVRKSGGVDRVRKGDSFRIERSPDGTFRHLTVLRGKDQIFVRPSSSTFTARRTSVPIRRVLKSVTGEMRSSLWVSMARGNVPAEVIQDYADVFQWSVDFLTEPRNGDRYAVTWASHRSPDGRVWKREVLAALYDGKVSGREIGIRFDDSYYDEKGETMQRMFLRAPLNYRRISSYFSKGRFHPILRKNRPHHGTDYAAPRGTPVVAVGAGTVSAVGWHGGFGKRVEIRHGPTWLTLYGHLDRFAAGLRSGQRVTQGQLIGYVGSTGLASGPHLHFQIAKSGAWVDYLRLNLPRASKIPVKDQKGFASVRAEMLDRLGLQIAPNAGNGK